MSEREERFEEALQRLLHWSRVYSRDVFPEPDWGKAGELLKAGGISIDVIRLHCMRHVMERVGQIAREALANRLRRQIAETARCRGCSAS